MVRLAGLARDVGELLCFFPCWYKQVSVLCPLQPPPPWPSCEQPRQSGLQVTELSYFLVSTLQQKNNNGMLFGLTVKPV